MRTLSITGILLVLPCLLTCIPAGFAQQPVQLPSRRTALGTPSLFPIEALKEAEKNKKVPAATPSEPIAQVLDRTANAHGGKQALKNIADSQADGTLAVFEATGASKVYSLTVLGKGEGQVQRIVHQPNGVQLKQGTDGGRTWDGIAGHIPMARGATLSFIELQTIRSVRALVDYAARGARLHDSGMQGTYRAVEIEESNGRATTYFLEASGRVARIEFNNGQAHNMLSGKMTPLVEAYEFSDYRAVQGILTPFTVTHYSNGIKADEALMSSIRYNASLPGDAFHP